MFLCFDPFYYQFLIIFCSSSSRCPHTDSLPKYLIVFCCPVVIFFIDKLTWVMGAAGSFPVCLCWYWQCVMASRSWSPLDFLLHHVPAELQNMDVFELLTVGVGSVLNCTDLTFHFKVMKFCFSFWKFGEGAIEFLFLPFYQKPDAEVTGKYVRISEREEENKC